MKTITIGRTRRRHHHLMYLNMILMASNSITGIKILLLMLIMLLHIRSRLLLHQGQYMLQVTDRHLQSHHLRHLHL